MASQGSPSPAPWGRAPRGGRLQESRSSGEAPGEEPRKRHGIAEGRFSPGKRLTNPQPWGGAGGGSFRQHRRSHALDEHFLCLLGKGGRLGRKLGHGGGSTCLCTSGRRSAHGPNSAGCLPNDGAIRKAKGFFCLPNNAVRRRNLHACQSTRTAKMATNPWGGGLQSRKLRREEEGDSLRPLAKPDSPLLGAEPPLQLKPLSLFKNGICTIRRKTATVADNEPPPPLIEIRWQGVSFSSAFVSQEVERG